MGVTVNEGFVYWASYQPGEIWRTDLAGQGATRVYSSGSSSSYTRHIQFYNNRMYWNEEGPGVIKSANLDGSSVTTAISGYPSNGDTQGIWDFKIANNRFYWTSWSNNRVYSSRLDGTDVQQFLVGTTRAFTIDSFASGLVFSTLSDSSHPGAPQIIRTDFNGGSQQVLAQLSTSSTQELDAVSVFGDRAYYSWRGTDATSDISSVPLAGGASRLEMSIPQQQTAIFQLDVVPSPGSGIVMLACGCLAAHRRRR
jgi:hypothetical protein